VQLGNVANECADSASDPNQNLHKWREKGRPIVMVTAYDYPGAVQADLAEIDIILVGDSVGMVELGHDTTQVSARIAPGKKIAALCGTFFIGTKTEIPPSFFACGTIKYIFV
jgi:hypothetical protein